MLLSLYIDPSMLVYTRNGMQSDQAVLRSPLQNLRNSIITVKIAEIYTSNVTNNITEAILR